METIRRAYLILWATGTFLAFIYAGGVLSHETRTPAIPDQPPVLVDCATAGCPTTSHYTPGQTVCIIWNGHPCR